MEAATETVQESGALSFKFTGNGKEYFGIWIVNLLLSIVTLGIYSAWAKVRRMQYFYRNTSLAESHFDYHGSPTMILKGRLIVVALLVAYNLAERFSPPLAMIAFVCLAAGMPFLLMRSLRFKLFNSSYRGLRFHFKGSLGGAYKVFLMWPILSAITLYTLAPVWHQRLKDYQHNNSAYGKANFSFNVPVSAFYKIYLTVGAVLIGLIVAIGFLFGGAIFEQIKSTAGGGNGYMNPKTMLLLFTFPLMIFGVGLLLRPYFAARFQNLIWNNTHLGPHRFVSNISARKLLLIEVTNMIGIIFTLGLFKPFAVIRTMQYKLESLALIPHGDLESFVASQEAQVSATGQEAADLFDIDIAL
ncbi:MAG: YjgN family protein [Pseudomonadota bacterium]